MNNETFCERCRKRQERGKAKAPLFGAIRARFARVEQAVIAARAERGAEFLLVSVASLFAAQVVVFLLYVAASLIKF